MNDEEDGRHPAMAKITLPPALVEELQTNPQLLVELTRGQLAIVQDRLVRKVLSDPEATVAQLAVAHERLAKNAGLEKKEGGTAAAGVTINIIRSAAPGKGVTIEGTAVAVMDDADA